MAAAPVRTASLALVEAKGLSKRFHGVPALKDASVVVRPGEVNCLIGENGAGKSTLVKIIAGVHAADSGELLLSGQPARLNRPSDALAAGVSTIFQEFTLAPAMTVAENILLGGEPTKFGVLRRREALERSRQVLHELGAPGIDPAAPVRSLGVADQQLVEIAKALRGAGERLLIMDEPTAVLSARETERLFDVIDRLTSGGTGILYITHRLEELDRIATRVTVMRDGVTVGSYAAPDVDRETLIEQMIGRSYAEVFPELPARADGAEVFRCSGVRLAPSSPPLSLAVRAGEVVGLFGLVGSGRTELARALVGVDGCSGDVYLGGTRARYGSAAASMGLGIGFVPEDRKRHGIVPKMDVASNVALSSLSALSHGPVLRPSDVRSLASSYAERLDIRPRDTAVPIVGLSGGNQQKAVIARVLARKPRFVVLDEPTRGVDVGARSELYKLIHELCASGVGVLLITSEAAEAIGMSHRVLVMRRGEIAGEVDHCDASEDVLMRLAFGQETSARPARATASATHESNE